MSRESLVAALEEAGVPEHSRYEIASDAAILLPLLLAHASAEQLAQSVLTASPEAKAAALRGLLGERIDQLKHRRSGGIADRVSFDLGTTAAASSASIEADLLLNTLAPEAP